MSPSQGFQEYNNMNTFEVDFSRKNYIVYPAARYD